MAMKVQIWTLNALAASLFANAILVLAVADMPPPPDLSKMADRDQLERCMDGWRGAIDSWNASTDRLTAIMRSGK